MAPAAPGGGGKCGHSGSLRTSCLECSSPAAAPLLPAVEPIRISNPSQSTAKVASSDSGMLAPAVIGCWVSSDWSGWIIHFVFVPAPKQWAGRRCRTDLVPLTLPVQSDDDHGWVDQVAVTVEGEVVVFPAHIQHVPARGGAEGVRVCVCECVAEALRPLCVSARQR